MGLDTVELVMSFEEAFGIEIPNELAAEMATPRDVRDFVLAEYARLGRPADPDAIFDKIRDLTVEIGGLKPEGVTLDSQFVHDLGLD